VNERAVTQHARRPPAQIVCLGIGLWWTINGIGAFLIDPNFATGRVHGGGDVAGVSNITVNGWHALFHLLPGLLGIALANRPRAAVAFTTISGATYVAAGCLGLLAGGSSLGVIAVDAPGDIVHLAEGLIALTAGLATGVRDRRRHREISAIRTRVPLTPPRGG
jgi:hypothetical protein